MATLYVSSVDGNDAVPPSVAWWNGNQNTYATVEGALAAATDAANLLYVDSAHAAVLGASISWRVSATGRAVEIVSVNRNTGAFTAGASEVVNANASFVVGSIAGTYIIRGMTLGIVTGTGTSKSILLNTNVSTVALYDRCTFDNKSTSNVTQIYVGPLSGSTPAIDAPTILSQCTVVIRGTAFGSGSKIFGFRVGSTVTIDRLTFSFADANRPLVCFGSVASGTGAWRARVTVSNSDLSGYNSGSLISTTDMVASALTFRNCLISDAVTFVSGTLPRENYITLVNCERGSTEIGLEARDGRAVCSETRSIYASGGASDAAGAVAWKVDTDATCGPLNAWYSPWIVGEWASGATTAAVSLVRDSASNLTDADVSLEVESLPNAGSPLGTTVSTFQVPIQTTGTALAADSTVWTGTGGFTNENKQKLSETISHARTGVIRARVVVRVASTTIYIDPKLRIS